MSIDVEGAKRKYLSQWQHCAGKRVTAIDSSLLCDCGARFPWMQALGEDVELALSLEWLSPCGDISESNLTDTPAQSGLFS